MRRKSFSFDKLFQWQIIAIQNDFKILNINDEPSKFHYTPNDTITKLYLQCQEFLTSFEQIWIVDSINFSEVTIKCVQKKRSKNVKGKWFQSKATPKKKHSLWDWSNKLRIISFHKNLTLKRCHWLINWKLSIVFASIILIKSKSLKWIILGEIKFQVICITIRFLFLPLYLHAFNREFNCFQFFFLPHFPYDVLVRQNMQWADDERC